MNPNQKTEPALSRQVALSVPAESCQQVAQMVLRALAALGLGDEAAVVSVPDRQQVVIHPLDAALTDHARP